MWGYQAIGALAVYLAATATIRSLLVISQPVRDAMTAGALLLLLPLLFLPYGAGGVRAVPARHHHPLHADEEEEGDAPATPLLLPRGSTAPTACAPPDLPDLTPLHCMCTTNFSLLFAALVLGSGAGLALLNNLAQLTLALGGQPDGQDVFISLFGVFSCVGELCVSCALPRAAPFSSPPALLDTAHALAPPHPPPHPTRTRPPAMGLFARKGAARLGHPPPALLGGGAAADGSRLPAAGALAAGAALPRCPSGGVGVWRAVESAAGTGVRAGRAQAREGVVVRVCVCVCVCVCVWGGGGQSLRRRAAHPPWPPSPPPVPRSLRRITQSSKLRPRWAPFCWPPSWRGRSTIAR